MEMEVLRAIHLMSALLAISVGCAGTATAGAGAAAPPASGGTIESPAIGLEAVLRRSPAVRPFVDDETYGLQVLVAVPTADGRGLARQGFRVDTAYFYPGSTVKLCSAVAALERLDELRGDDTSSALDTQTPLQVEGGKVGMRTSLAAAVDQALVFSDNAAHNLLYDFSGQDGIHERMWRLGLDSVRIRHRLAVDATDDPRETPRIELHVPNAEPVVLPARTGSVALGRNEMPGVLVGEEHVSGRSVLAGPMAFDAKNRVSLADLQELLVAVVRPELRPPPVPRLGVEERNVLLEALAALPSDRGASAARDVEHKPIRAGVARVIAPRDLVTYSKAGRAYGFVVDDAYFFDKRSGKSFFITATVYANGNGRVADDVYDYARVAFPLLADLGEAIAREQLETGGTIE